MTVGAYDLPITGTEYADNDTSVLTWPGRGYTLMDEEALNWPSTIGQATFKNE